MLFVGKYYFIADKIVLFYKNYSSSLSTQLLLLHAVCSSLVLTTATTFSTVPLPHLSIPFNTQNKLAKLVRLNPSLNSSECLTQLDWLPIDPRIIFKISLITYRTLATSNPPNLNHLIHLCRACCLERPSPHHSVPTHS